jgi:predicted DNA-binding transcriptional regulator YafY
VATLLGVDTKGVARWIDRLNAAAPEDAEPGDHVDAEIEGDRVRIWWGPKLPGPTRFTVRETVALLVALGQVASDETGRESPLGQRLDRLREKLLSAVVSGSQEVALDAASRVRVQATGGEAAEILTVLEEAVAERREVEIAYYNRSRDTVWRRQVQPYLLVQHRGTWYLVTGGDYRLRVDMIRDASPCDARFEVPADFDAERYRRDVMFEGEAAHELTLRTSRGLRTVRTASPGQVRAWVRTTRGGVVIEAPEEEREAMAREVGEILERYGAGQS